MIGDLSKELMHRRPSRTEVVEWLGEPDFRNEPRLMSYNLGMWSGLRMDFDSLDIEFDEAGRVRHVRSVQH